MSIFVSCFECMRQGNLSAESRSFYPYNDDNAYVATCDNGHVTHLVLQTPRHEILAEIGVGAFIDGYPSQSVSSFATSLERCYEWYVKVTYLHRYKNLDLFDRVWKSVKSQSERQLGLFIFAYSTAHSDVPPLLSEKQASVRNSVVHKGAILSPDVALQFAQEVVDHVQKIHAVVQDSFAESRINLEILNIINSKKTFPANANVWSMGMRTPYSIRVGDDITRDIETIVGVTRKSRDAMRNVLGASIP